jgi:hypothetical protein
MVFHDARTNDTRQKDVWKNDRGPVTARVRAAAQSPDLGLLNHGKPIVHAHNCYPYDGRWTDRFGSAFPSLALK